ncbi:MucR family transcriptional regulator [Xanthobacteraceae bacterium A53D]
MGEGKDILLATAYIVSSYIGSNTIDKDKISELIELVHGALRRAQNPDEEQPASELIPAVPIKKSITSDALISLEDGKPYKILKRHLMSNYGLTPEAYRAKWGLPFNYPMVAPNYSAVRSGLARAAGLGLAMEAPQAPPRKRRKAG